MDYSLSTFVLTPSFASLAHFGRPQALPERSRAQRLEAMAGAVRRMTGLLSSPAPDVLRALPDDEPDRAWLAEVALTAHELVRAGGELELVACEHTPGVDGEAVAVFIDRGRMALVRPGDSVQAGVAILRSPTTGLCVMPRVFRKVCSNGAVVDASGGEGFEVEVHEVAEAMRTCLEPEGFEAAVARFRLAAIATVHDPFALALEVGTVTPAEQLLLHREEGDDSLFGLINAATATAHGDARWSDRLDRERDAQRLLAARHSGSPSTRMPVGLQRRTLQLARRPADSVRT